MPTIPVIIHGLTESQPSLGGAWEGTVNLWQDDEGYLTNYAGRTDFFHRVVQPDVEPPERSTAPALADEYTRIFSFTDFIGVEHLVVVKGNGLYEVYGNTLRLLHTLRGRNVEGLYYPRLFLHESKLILVNDGDVPYLWDGVHGVQPLGVQETPSAPQIWSTPAPGTDDGYRDGIWRWGHLWWPQTFPFSGPSSALDVDGNKTPGFYQLRLQYQDRYGNRGQASPPSALEKVDAALEVTDVNGGTWDSPRFLGCDWLPPQLDSHIYYVKVARTTNQNPQATTFSPGNHQLYYVEKTFEGTTLSRHVSQVSDADLVLGEPLDLEVRPPFAAVGGCSARGRIFLFRENRLEWSDAGLFGQFRATQQHVAYDDLTSVHVTGDRVAVISKSSIEVLYETNTGHFAILDQDHSQGSDSPGSFVEAPGGLFGLFREGFGFFDGVKVTYVESPYYLERLYQDYSYRITDAVIWRNRYVAVVRKDYESDQPNYLLMYDFKTTNWFLIAESVRGLVVHQGKLLGVKDSIYELFRGTYDESTLKLHLLAPEGINPFASRALAEVRLLMEPSSSAQATLSIYARYSAQSSTSSFPLLAGKSNAAERSTYLVPHWNQQFLSYGDSPEWDVPGLMVLTPGGSLPVHGNTHELQLDLPAGHLIRLLALHLYYGQDAAVEYG